MALEIDPGHAEKRRRISVLSLVLLVFGLALLVYGVVEFSSGFFRPSSEFFADPNRVMDEDGRSGFTGLLCCFVGAVSAMFGARGLVFARAGSILRYAAGETAPVAKDTFDYVADGAQGGVEKLARAVKRGVSADPSGETIKIRCRACGYLESEDAKFCSGCGKAI